MQLWHGKDIRRDSSAGRLDGIGTVEGCGENGQWLFIQDRSFSAGSELTTRRNVEKDGKPHDNNCSSRRDMN